MKTLGQFLDEGRLTTVALVHQHLTKAREHEDNNSHAKADHHFDQARKLAVRLTDPQKATVKQKFNITL